MEFREFHLYDDKLFTVDNGNKFNKNAMSFKSPSVNFVGRSASNNGITAIVDRVLGVEPYKGGSLTLALGGSIGCCFLQEQDFYTGQNLAVLMPKWGMSTEIKLYIATCISKVAKNSYKAFSDELNKHIHTDFMFKLPAKSITLIDYDCIEHIGGGLDNMSNIDTSSWKEFKLCDLFSASNGDVDIQQKDINEKGTYVVTSGEQNNGILGKSDREARVFSADTLTVDMFGNVYYRDYEYKLVTHARVFSLKPLFVMNREIGLFMVSLLKFLTEIYSYTNMCSWSKIKDLSIKLPVTTVYEPDFDYMEEYIRIQKKLAIKDAVLLKDKIIEETKKVVE